MTGKPCKYECGQMLSWDTGKSKFVEADGTEHTKERCAYMKSIKPKATQAPAPASPPANHYAERDAAIAKMHDEKMASEKAQTAATNSLAAILAVTNDTLQQLAIILKDFKEQVENLNKEKGASFTSAAEVAKRMSTAG